MQGGRLSTDPERLATLIELAEKIARNKPHEALLLIWHSERQAWECVERSYGQLTLGISETQITPIEQALEALLRRYGSAVLRIMAGSPLILVELFA